MKPRFQSMINSCRKFFRPIQNGRICYRVFYSITLLIIFACGCDNRPSNPDYFPHQPGTEWTYLISTSAQPEPTRFAINHFPVGNKEVMYANSGKFYGAVQHPELKTFELRFRVKSRASEQGPLSYANGVELEVLKDEFNFFHQAKRVFWAIAPDGQVTQVVMIPRKTGVPDGGRQQDGHNRRLIFFLDDRLSSFIGKPYNTLWEQPQDKLSFMGIEGSCVRFKREVDHKGGFTEETWFENGKGLTRMEQKIGGKITMSLELKRFSQSDGK